MFSVTSNSRNLFVYMYINLVPNTLVMLEYSLTALGVLSSCSVTCCSGNVDVVVNTVV